MSKRGNDSETEHSTSKKVNPQRLDFKSANETNNVTIRKINAMISLVEDHMEALRGARLITTIILDRQPNGDTTLALRSIKYFPPTPCSYTIELNGRKMKFTISELSALLPMFSPDKETIVLDSLKNAVGDTMVFYGRLVKYNRDIHCLWEELALKTISGYDYLKLDTNLIQSTTLMHKDLETIEGQTLWQEWSTAVIAYLKYVSKATDMNKRN